MHERKPHLRQRVTLGIGAGILSLAAVGCAAFPDATSQTKPAIVEITPGPDQALLDNEVNNNLRVQKDPDEITLWSDDNYNRVLNSLKGKSLENELSATAALMYDSKNKYLSVPARVLEINRADIDFDFDNSSDAPDVHATARMEKGKVRWGIVFSKQRTERASRIERALIISRGVDELNLAAKYFRTLRSTIPLSSRIDQTLSNLKNLPGYNQLDINKTGGYIFEYGLTRMYVPSQSASVLEYFRNKTQNQNLV